MSFFTFSSEPHRLFARWLLTLVILPVSGLFAMGVYLQPFYGDLTRLGFYPAKDFGWNSPQVIFPNTQLDMSATLEDKGWHYDILVLGDSFSRAQSRRELQWQNYLTLASAASVGTLDIYKVHLSQILASREFREHPPKVLILESVERILTQELNNNHSCQPSQILPRAHRGDGEPVIGWIQGWKGRLADVTTYMEREARWKDISIGYEWKYLWHTLLGADQPPLVRSMTLSRPAPFSSRNKQQLLVINEDLDKIKWWAEMGMAEMNCSIEVMRTQVEANGYTRFVLMVPPDKLTAYADYLSDSSLMSVSRLSPLADIHPDVMPRLDKALTQAIGMGEQDVYLPDDTHWGSNGQRIAAETLISFLARPVQ